ncbi:MAG: histidine--tRNA ligase [Anaerolineaceae bacterium]|jgi:histidyl-tRNA synthetase|nr:MAG: histidine--tRNA ligase [Anaerolineaceae bacterium]
MLKSFAKSINTGRKMKNIIPSVKGTREFYPEDMVLRQWLYKLIREVSESFGYQEYDGPFLETLELYAAKSGEELVKEQSFVFQDRGGNKITLRPELTPSLARMIAQRQNELAFPLRWWSFGPFWRYEKPQKGRTREFFQWNADLIGMDSPQADAEVIALCAAFFQKAHLTKDEVRIFVNDRQLMENELVKLGFAPEQHKLIFKLIDRRDKLSEQGWDAYVIEAGLAGTQLDALKNLIQNHELWYASEKLTRIFEILDFYGLGEFVSYDPRIIRGLDYYTGVVFEAKDIGENKRAILGGGHYGNLVAEVGGESLPGVGFAMGDVVFPLVLESYGKTPQLQRMPASVLVTVFDDASLPASIALCNRLRARNIPVALYPEADKLGKQFKYADRCGFKGVLVIGPDELQKGEVVLKDLASREQVFFPNEELERKVGEWLAAKNGS